MGGYIGGILGLYWDNGEIMETTIGFKDFLFGDTMVPNITPIMENQMEKNMENEMEAGII